MKSDLDAAAARWAALWFSENSTAEECDAAALDVAEHPPDDLDTICSLLEIAALRLGAEEDLSVNGDVPHEGVVAIELIRTAIEGVKKICAD